MLCIDYDIRIIWRILKKSKCYYCIFTVYREVEWSNIFYWRYSSNGFVLETNETCHFFLNCESSQKVSICMDCVYIRDTDRSSLKFLSVHRIQSIL